MTPVTTATDALTALEQMALDAERLNRYEPQSLRTVEHLIDGTLMNGTTPRLRLLVIAAYRAFYETMATYGKMEVCARAHCKPFLVYAALRYPTLTPIRLTRAQAVELLDVRELPVALWPKTPVAVDEWDVDAFFEREAATSYGRNRVGRARS